MHIFTELINDLTHHMSCRELGMFAGTCKKIRDASTQAMETMKRVNVKNGVFPGDGFFDIYSADLSIKLRFFRGLDKTQKFSFSTIEYNGRRYDIDTVLYLTKARVSTDMTKLTRYMYKNMRSRVVKALWIREFYCYENNVYVELVVEHPAFANAFLIINADKQ